MSVTVIMTVHNGQHTIKKSIDCILSQTYSNFEFVIVDDGSTDKTKQILHEYEKNDNRIRVIYMDKIGRSKALNIALKKSRGRFIANIDADDESHPDRLMKEYSFLMEYPEIGLVASNAEIIFDNETVKWKEYENKKFDAVLISDILKRKNPIPHSSVMINTDVIRKEDYIYNENLSRVVDYDLWIKLYKKGYRLALLNEKLVTKRIHENQSFENKNRKNYLEDVKKVQLNNFSHQLSLIDYLYIQGKFCYGLFPQKIRMKFFKKKLN